MASELTASYKIIKLFKIIINPMTKIETLSNMKEQKEELEWWESKWETI